MGGGRTPFVVNFPGSARSSFWQD